MPDVLTSPSRLLLVLVGVGLIALALRLAGVETKPGALRVIVPVLRLAIAIGIALLGAAVLSFALGVTVGDLLDDLRDLLQEAAR